MNLDPLLLILLLLALSQFLLLETLHLRHQLLAQDPQLELELDLDLAQD